MRTRESARIILLDELNHLLLFDVLDEIAVNPLHPSSGRFWCAIGGGMEPGETIEQTALREIREETGFTEVMLGERLDRIEADLLFNGVPTHIVNHFIVGRVNRTEIDYAGMEALERSMTMGHRWWSYDELLAEAPDVRPRQIIAMMARTIAISLS